MKIQVAFRLPIADRSFVIHGITVSQRTISHNRETIRIGTFDFGGGFVTQASDVAGAPNGSAPLYEATAAILFPLGVMPPFDDNIPIAPPSADPLRAMAYKLE